MFFRKLRFLLPILFLAFAINSSVRAQGTTATVSGFVADASGAQIPGATVTFINTGTNVATTATANGAGAYRVAGLLPGTYRSTVTMTGFKTVAREGIELHLEDAVTINFGLEVGATSETVTVDAGAQILETSSPTVSQIIEGRQVEDTPLNGRNAMNLVALTPGVTPQGSSSGSSSNNTNGGSYTNSFGYNNYQIAGALANTGSVYLDGQPTNLTVGHVTPFVITQDAVQEFRVESSVVNPQYGEFGGGVILFGTKSGTDSFHGSVYEYLRNTKLNANTFFNNRTGVARPQFIQNQFGTTIGGPIKHSKAFFFFSYEGFRLAEGVPNLGIVPTTAELSGDFRADAPIFDPTTGPGTAKGGNKTQISCMGVANVICMPGQTGSGITVDPTEQAIADVVKYFPTPNTTAGGTAFNFSQNAKANASSSEYDVRVDENLGKKQKLFARYTFLDRVQQPTQYYFNTTGPSSGPGVHARAQSYVLGDTITVSSTSVIDLRASYLRYFVFTAPQNTNFNLAQLGPFYAAIQKQVTFREFPNIIISNTISQPFGQLDTTTIAPSNNYVLSGTYTKVLGRHTIAVGGEGRQREQYANLAVNSSGFFIFAGAATDCIPAAGSPCVSPAGVPLGVFPPGSGANPIADFVTGVTTASLGFTTFRFPSVVNNYGGAFVNETFQMSPRLTITAGLRYELPGGFTEKHDSNTVLLPQLANPLVLVNTPAYPSRSDLSSHYKLFSPRVGFAFQPQPGTTVRAGYSLSYFPMDTIYNSGPSGSPVNSPNTSVTPGSLLSQPLHGLTTLLEPIGRAYNGTQFLNQAIQGRIANSAFPYLQQWNANVQQNFTSSTVFQLAYLGARGEHLPLFGTAGIDQLPDQYDGMTQAQLTVMGGGVFAPKLRPYPIYQNVTAISPYIGDSYYHSLQATLNKRFKGDGTLLVNYSYSKFESNAEANNTQVETHATGLIQDYNNLRGERSLLSFDVPHRLVVSYILDLPFGKGKRFLPNASGLTGGLVTGWNASGINTFQSGMPDSIITTANLLANLYGAGTIRPNVVAGCAKVLGGSALAKAGKPLLNKACFSAPAATSFGNEPRVDGQIRSQGIDNWDFSIGKTTPIREGINLVFRAEAFNVTNRTQFGDPSLNSSSSIFGIVTTQVNSPRLFQFSLRANY